MEAGNSTELVVAQAQDEAPGLNTAQRTAIKAVVNRAREICGLCFGVYVGPMAQGRDFAIAQHATMPDPLAGVLIAVDPEARIVEVVTGTDAERVLDNRSCELAVLAMTSCFAGDDIVAGVREGVQLLAEHARTPRVWHLDDVD